MAKPTTTQTAAAATAALADLRQLSPPLPVDEFHGVGGEYELVDGKRVRVGGPALPELQTTPAP